MSIAINIKEIISNYPEVFDKVFERLSNDVGSLQDKLLKENMINIHPDEAPGIGDS